MTKKLFFVSVLLAAVCCAAMVAGAGASQKATQMVSRGILRKVSLTEELAGGGYTPAALSLTGNSHGRMSDHRRMSEHGWMSDLPWMSGEEAVISEFDPVIRRVASDKGFDWRLVSAIAYTESRFDDTAVSNAGAVGLMQVMPSVARSFNVSQADAADPHTNVMLGVSLLERIAGTFRFPRTISERDRLSIILAAYNCGIGHVLDARRLAVKYGEDHNSWNVVAKYLCLKSEPLYFEDEASRCGAFFDNAQTLGFVRKVMRRYDSYCELAMI